MGEKKREWQGNSKEEEKKTIMRERGESKSGATK